MLFSRALLKRHSVLPGFDLALGFTLLYLELHRADPAVGGVPQDLHDDLAGVLGRGHLAARAWPRTGSPSAPRSLAALLNAVFGLHRRLGAGALRVSRQAPRRRAGRPAVRAADGGGRHRADRALLAATAGSASSLPFKVSFTPLGVFVALTFIGLPFVVRTVQPVLEDLQQRARGSRGDARREPLADLHARDPADPDAGAADRLRARLRARARRIRLGHLHRRQHADGQRRSRRCSSSPSSSSTTTPAPPRSRS